MIEISRVRGAVCSFPTKEWVPEYRSRPSREGRGLKHPIILIVGRAVASPLSRGARIEIAVAVVVWLNPTGWSHLDRNSCLPGQLGGLFFFNRVASTISHVTWSQDGKWQKSGYSNGIPSVVHSGCKRPNFRESWETKFHRDIIGDHSNRTVYPCRRGDSNPHAGCPTTDFKSVASTIPPRRLPARMQDALQTRGVRRNPCKASSPALRKGASTQSASPRTGLGGIF